MKPTRRMIPVILFLAVIPAASFATAPAGNPLQVEVSFADLDTSRAEGVSRLYRRITRAARSVCRPHESRDIGLARRFDACVAAAIDDAVADAGLPQLTEQHETLQRHADSGASKSASRMARVTAGQK